VKFRAVVEKYKAFTEKLVSDLPELSGHVRKLVEEREGPSYTVKSAVVYNSALDTAVSADIRMILVADNPGRREQEKGLYLIGPSGKIAENFFRDKLNLDFRKNVLILNKTPIHTPRTAELKELCRLGGKKITDAVVSSQNTMAELLLEFWKAGETQDGAGKTQGKADGKPLPVWIIGYSEMKKGGIFETYTEKLKALCAANPSFKDSIFFFRHFSMNQFTIDLHKQALPEENLSQSLERIGEAYRRRILG
jgi:hypothetical protein